MAPLGRALAPGDGKMRDPGNEVGSRTVLVVARLVFTQRQYWLHDTQVFLCEGLKAKN